MTLITSNHESVAVEPFQAAWEDGAYMVYRGRRRLDDASSEPVLLMTPVQEHPRAEVIDRLAHEYALAPKLAGGSTLRPVALMREQGRMLLVFEHCDGEPLTTLSAPLDAAAFLRLAVSIASALGKVHAQGLVHRDINSTHILMDRSTGAVCITGFGIASSLRQEMQSPEAPEFIAGTPAYMAPEQTGRMNRSVDSRSDLYSLGVVFYRLLTGRLPFDATDPMALMHCHIATQAAPPADVLGTVPPAISAIVMKLLAKTAEERYQTAGGVAHDLRQCLARWDAHGRIAGFALGQVDLPDKLLVPEKLYGRKTERDTLLDAFDRVVKRGRAELLLVSGYAGIGKSAVVNELHKALLPRSGLFLAGKFDQINRGIPYATLAKAFQAGVRMLLSKSESELDAWRTALRDALGANGLLMTDLVPDLAKVIGEQPPVAVLSAQDAQRRFHMVFRRFIAVFARADHPLALFVDDLQWLDMATLDFLEDLLMQNESGHLLVIGAYRDNEVGPDHPLMRKLANLRAAGVAVQEIALRPLAGAHLEQFVTDALHCPTTKAVPLARMLHQKTGGNPFFVHQFLTSLGEEGLVAFDHISGQWTWDLDRINAKGYTENVVDLMVAKLARLPPGCQAVLRQFACVGNAARLASLEIICEMPGPNVREALAAAVQAGLVLRTGTAYRFLHDRVQEAAYALIPACERAATHLRIARLLLAHTPPGQREELVFEIVGQFNRAASSIVDDDEREQVAALNLLAGGRAKASAAYASALAYLAAGSDLLTDEDWDRRYELSFSIEFLRAECELLCTRMSEAEARLAGLEQRARTRHHVAQVTRLRITLCTTQDLSERSVAICLDYLRRNGTDWSAHPSREAVHEEYARIGALLGGRDIEDLIRLPLLDNPDVQDTLDVLSEIVTPAFFTDSNLCALVLCRMVRLSLEHGNADASCYAYVWLAAYTGPFFDQYEAGYRFGCLGHELVEQRGLTRYRARTSTSFGNIVVPWARHVREGRKPIQRAFKMASETGDLTYTLYSCCDLIQNHVSVGDPLDDVKTEIDVALSISERVRFGLVSDMLVTYRGLVRTLCGLTQRFGSFDDETFNEAAFEAHFSQSPTLALPAFDYWVRKLQARYFADEFADALEAKHHAAQLLWVGTSQFETAEFHFYGALSHAACWDTATPEDRHIHAEAIAAHRGQLEVWARHCPENFENRALLVSAEWSRLHGDVVAAQRLYDLAIRSARANGFVHNEAVACQAAARFHAAQELTEIAQMYLRNARDAFMRWGAKAKVRQIDAALPRFAHRYRESGGMQAIEAPVEHLDLVTVIRLSQTISSEIVLDNLIHTVMRTAISHAGAERGLLIASDENGLRIEAEARTVDGIISVNLENASLTSGRVPISVVQFAFRMRENVIVDDATRQHDFSADPYFRDHHARSVACMPLVHRGKPIALLYLENNLVSHVFNASRVAVLKLLASQAATSLEISHLYRDLAEREARIRRLVDANIVGVFIWDLRGPIYEANDAFLRIIDYTREDLAAGRVNCMEITPDEWHEQDLRSIAELRRNGALQPVEKEYIRSDGSRVPVLLGAAMFGNATEQLVAFVVDLTERKRAEATARDSERRFHEIERELAHANRIATLGQLTASISHEIRQPVASAVFNAQAAIHWLEARPPNLDEVHAALTRVVNNGTRASDVIRRIRELVKKAPVRHEHLAINDAVHEVVALVRGEAAKQHVRVETELERGLPPVEGDRVQLQQILMNLMMNAVEAMVETSDTTRDLRIVSRLDEGESDVIIAVSDTGRGIDEANVEQLFEPFYTTKATGMGMGLSICRSIVDAHGGTLRVLPNEPQGAVFELRLAAARKPGA
ncbi:AAA family ATPase [Caballeronia sp. LZ035]|uniref:trifunctional serine/threonine-protein kinase/ATP-binding protein/sensor histidine kinase n=1 Tax=Caballeronia sp. LZ035 TaxID=3038568 RepID=UPI002857078B|nr:AAA family ATPase [Caballeronia sp. LZ035]MDR5760843.1 AAA family ATPase [Caballeronia sp. LZ035]